METFAGGSASSKISKVLLFGALLCSSGSVFSMEKEKKIESIDDAAKYLVGEIKTLSDCKIVTFAMSFYVDCHKKEVKYFWECNFCSPRPFSSYGRDCKKCKEPISAAINKKDQIKGLLKNVLEALDDHRNYRGNLSLQARVVPVGIYSISSSHSVPELKKEIELHLYGSCAAENIDRAASKIWELMGNKDESDSQKKEQK